MMETLQALSLQQPLWLLLLPLPWLLGRVLQRGKRRRLSRLIAPQLWPWLLPPAAARRQLRTHSFLAAWVLALLAVSGPGLPRHTSGGQVPAGSDIVVIMDISPSMNVQDMTPNRLDRAKFELRDFTRRLRGDRVALLAFSANSYPLLPLTRDYDTLLHFSDALNTRLTRNQGSNLPQALELARKLLAHSPHQGRAIVLLSDGETHDPEASLAAGRRLGKAGIPIYILGIGTRSGGPVYDRRGRFLRYHGKSVISRLNTPLLIQLTRLSGGIYSQAQTGDSDWQRLLTGLQQLRRAAGANRRSTQQPVLIYQWLLLAALLLLFWPQARRLLPLGLLLLLPIPAPHTAQASPWREQAAYQALLQGQYQRADTLYRQQQDYRGYLGSGVAAYRRGQWQTAGRAFRQALQRADDNRERARAVYNLGNTLARQGQPDKAAEAFKQALLWRPDFPRATRNLAIVEQLQQRSTAQRRQQVPGKADDQARHRLAGGAQKIPAGRRPTPAARTGNAGRPQTDTDRNDLASAPGVSMPGGPIAHLSTDARIILQLRIAAEDGRYGAIVRDKPW